MAQAARQELDDTRRARHVDRAGHGRDAVLRERRPAWALEADDVADAVMYAVCRPNTVDVNDILVRPILQPE